MKPILPGRSRATIRAVTLGLALVFGALALSLPGTALADHGGGHGGGGGGHFGGGHFGGDHFGGGHFRGDHFHGGHFFGGFGLGFGLGWPYYWDWPYAYGAWPYDYYPPYYAAPAPAAAPVPLAPQAQSWYYCDSPKGYYPYVQSCGEPWRPVPATPPGVTP